MTAQGDGPKSDTEHCLNWFDAERLDKKLLGRARRLDYRIFAITAPCRPGGRGQGDLTDELIKSVVKHCDLLACSLGPLASDADPIRGERRRLGLLVASRQSEEQLPQLLSPHGIEVASSIPYDALQVEWREKARMPLDASVEEGASLLEIMDAVAAHQTEQTDRDVAQPIQSIAYRFKENAMSTIDRASDNLAQFTARTDDLQALRAALRSIHKLRGLATMFGLECVARLSYTLEWAFEMILENSQVVTDDLLEALDATVTTLPAHVAHYERGEACTEEINGSIERLIALLEPEVSSPLNLDAPDSGALEALIDLDPQLIACASPFEKRLILDAVEQGRSCYVVTVRPSERILKTSFEPLDLYGMLEVAGDVLLNLPILEDVPDITDYDVDRYYFGFKFLITSDYSPEQLGDILATFYEVGEINAVRCNKGEVSAQLQHAQTSWMEQSQAQDVAPVPSAPGHQGADAAIADLSTCIQHISGFAYHISEFMEKDPQARNVMGRLCHDFCTHIAALRDVTRQLQSGSLICLLQEIPRAVRDVSRQSARTFSVRVRASEIQIDADLLELISGPIVDLAVSFVQKDIELPASPSEATEITVSADDRDDSVVLMVSGKRCRAESQHSAVITVLKRLDAMMLEHFGAGGLTLDGDDVACCWLRFPKFPTDAPVREFRTADFTFVIPHSLILDVSGPDLTWPVLPYHYDGPCPRARLQLDATGKYLDAARVAEEPANAPITVTLGYGLKRLLLEVDELGEKRRALYIKSDLSKGEPEPVPFVWRALLDNGELVPFISPARLAQHLNLE